MFDGCLRDEQKTEYVDVKYPVELVWGDGIYWAVLVYAGVVHEDVEAAVDLYCGLDEAPGLLGIGDVAANGNGFATGGLYSSDDDVGAGLA